MERRPNSIKHMVRRARQLRRESSFPERLLWSRLRYARCAGLKFRRQHPIGPYVVDYYCPAVGVVLELDGRSHDDRREYDQRREDFLVQQGLRVIRISNDRLLSDLDGVVEAIAAACTPSPGPAGRPLPEGEE